MCIRDRRCIDCSMCIRVCPYHAKRAKSDAIDIINNYKYKIALPAPTLYGQFNNLDDIDIVLTGLKQMGFDKIFEVSRACLLYTSWLCIKAVIINIWLE